MPHTQPPSPGQVGLVLSGGGARGAYEAGVVAGIVEVLGRRPQDPAPFSIFAGTSVGAINAAFLAASTHRGDLCASDLMAFWQSLTLKKHLKFDPLGVLGWPRRLPLLELAHAHLDPQRLGPRFGRSLLDPRALDHIVRTAIPWRQLHTNVAEGRTRALLVAALHIASGRTTVFAELAPGLTYRPSKDPRRQSSLKPVSADHILASAAIPMVFPARRIESTYYCDGGLRFNTPISPAIRAGAERLVVVSLLHRQPHDAASVLTRSIEEAHLEQYPSLTFLAGKLLDALLLDPVMYDLQMLDRINGLFELLERTLSPEEMATVSALLVAKRGTSYRPIKTMVFAPSEDIGNIAGDFLREHIFNTRTGKLLRGLLFRRVTAEAQPWEADLASYILFDGRYAQRLIDLGRRDALRRANDIHKFFRQDPSAAPSTVPLTPAQP
jgi:NTE family protein